MALRPDLSFYPSPRLAKEAPPEKLAYVTAIDPAGISIGDKLHHFGGCPTRERHPVLELLNERRSLPSRQLAGRHRALRETTRND